MSNLVKVLRWNPETDEATEVVVDLEAVIRNPNGINMETLGLALLNTARKERGLSQYVYNIYTGTYDEVG